MQFEPSVRADSGRDRYSPVIIGLHWLIAALILGMIALGYYMGDVPRNSPQRALLVNAHKSTGLLVLVLVMVRVIWRGVLEPARTAALTRRQQHWAVASHTALYAFMIVQPLTGYIASSFGRYGVAFFGIDLPSWTQPDTSLRESFMSAHRVAIIGFMSVIAIHIAAALRHYFARDGVFRRMWPWA